MRTVKQEAFTPPKPSPSKSIGHTVSGEMVASVSSQSASLVEVLDGSVHDEMKLFGSPYPSPSAS